MNLDWRKDPKYARRSHPGVDAFEASMPGDPVDFALNRVRELEDRLARGETVDLVDLSKAKRRLNTALRDSRKRYA